MATYTVEEPKYTVEEPKAEVKYTVEEPTPFSLKQFMFTPISKQLTGKTLIERANLPLERASKEAQRIADIRALQGKPMGMGEFFLRQHPAATQEALLRFADVSPFDIGTMLAIGGLTKVPYKGVPIGEIAAKVPLGKGFLKNIKELGRYKQWLKTYTPLSSRGIPVTAEVSQKQITNPVWLSKGGIAEIPSKGQAIYVIDPSKLDQTKIIQKGRYFTYSGEINKDAILLKKVSPEGFEGITMKELSAKGITDPTKLFFHTGKNVETLKPQIFNIEPEMAGSLRLSKFPQETRPVIQQAQPIKPPVRTFAEQRATAEQLKATINLDTLKPQDILNAEMRRASALKVVDNAKSALASNKLEDMQAVYGQIQKINNLHNEAGRLLGSLRDPLFDADDEAIKLISEGLQKVIPESKESLVKFFKMATQPRLWDKFMEYRTASLLTSPYTHERNIIGNIIGRLFKIPERVIGGGADAIRSFVTRQPRERYATEAIADIVGSGRGIRLGTKNAINAFINEEFTMSSRIREALRFNKAIPGVIGKIIRLPFRALNAMDEFFSTWATTSDLYAQAYRQALREGGRDVISRTAQLVRKPTLEMVANASSEALYQTYRQSLGAGGKAIQSSLIKTKVGKFIVPFFRTPVNLFKWTFDRSPLGLYKFATKSFYQLSAGEKADVVGKVALGQLVSAGIAYEAWQGNITGRLSNKKAEREALMRQGIMPYSVKIGNRYISYRSFEPISSWMGLISNSVEQWKEKDEEPAYGQVANIIGETTKFMKDQPFLMGIGDLFNAMDDPDRYGQRFVQNMVTSVTTPTGVGYGARLLDPTIREPETIPEAIKARIPFLSKKVAPKLDVWGRPITKEGKLYERALNPAGVVTYKPDLTEQELLSLEKFPQKITKKYREIPLSIDERNIITRVEGGITKRILDKLVTMPEYQKLNTFEREKEVDRVIREIRTETRREFLEKKIINDLRKMTNREDKIKYIQGLIEKKIIKAK